MGGSTLRTVLLAVLLWVFVSLARATPAAAATDAEAPPACDDARRTLAAYEALYAHLPASDDAGPVRLPFRHLVALVPDAVDASRAGSFDAALEGIEEAVATAEPPAPGIHYVRDRSVLPWPGDSAAKKARRCWESEPGIVLYRPTGRGVPVDPTRVPTLLVLVVGETPTWGVRRAQLVAALDLVDELGAWPLEANTIEDLILGPTFSGTADSLAAVLHARPARSTHAPERPLSYRIESGTATNLQVERTLATNAAANPAHLAIAYDVVTPTDDRLLGEMLTFLETRGATCGSDAEPGNVVLFTESVTAYGASAGEGPSPGCVTELKFPPSLAPLQPAGAATAEGRAASGASPAPVSGPALGELSDDTPAVHSEALGEVLRHLSRRRTRFVGIAATDPRDVVLLAGRIRAELPDIRLFTLGADLRYVDPGNAGAVNGMLVAHAGPESDAILPSVALANAFVRDVSRAARALLEGKAPPASRVRISLVGNGALWQIGPDSQAPSLVGRVPIGWTFVFVLFTAIFLFVVAAVFSPRAADLILKTGLLDASKTTGFLRHRGFMWTHVGRCEHVDLAADDRFVTAALLFIAGGPALLMAVSWIGRDPTFTPIGGMLVCVAATAVLVSLPWGFALARVKDATLSTIILAFAATVAGAAGLGLGCGRYREATFNLMSGGSPVLAGIIGFSMIGLGLVCWRVRLRFLDAHRFGVRPAARRPFFHAMPPPIAQALGEELACGKDTSGLVETERRLLDTVRSPWITFMAVPATVHLLLVFSLLVPICIKRPQTLEPTWRNTLLVLFGSLAFLPITANYSRVVATWVLLKRLLGRVASHPAVAALKTLPPALVRPLGAQLAMSGSSVDDLAYPLRVLERLTTTYPALGPTYARCAERMSTELRYEAGETVAVPPDATASAEAVADALLEVSFGLSRARPYVDGAQQTAFDEFTASLLAVFVPRYVRHFRLFVPPVIAGSVLAVIMTSLYFVEPERLLTTLIFFWIAVMVLTVFVVYADLDRDVVLSAIGGTTAGVVRFDWSLARRVVSWGLVPLGSLVAAQYPVVGSWLLVAVDSLLKGFR